MNGKLSLPDREVWGEHQDPVTVSWQKDGKGGKLRTPSVPLTISLTNAYVSVKATTPAFSCSLL